MPINNQLADALRAICNQRDYHAEHGHYQPGTMEDDQCFDDWAADIAETVLAEYDAEQIPAAPSSDDREAQDRYTLGDLIRRSWLKHGSDSWCSIADDVIAALRQQPVQAAPTDHIRTGLRDKAGREMCVGDRVVDRNESKHTKPEYWNPEFIVDWKAPSFFLRHVGGGKNSDTSCNFHFRCYPHQFQTLEIAEQQPVQAASEDMAEHCRQAGCQVLAPCGTSALHAAQPLPDAAWRKAIETHFLNVKLSTLFIDELCADARRIAKYDATLED